MELPITSESIFCEVNNNEIQAFANKFVVPNDPLSTAKEIYKFVRDKIDYDDSYSNTKKGAYKTLEDKKGNCCDQAHLLVALLRAVGIPTYYAHGTNHWWAVPCLDKQYHCDPTNKKHQFGIPQHGGKHPKVQLYNSLDH